MWHGRKFKKFSVFSVTPSQIKLQTIQNRKSQIWEMKEDKYTKSLAKNQVCNISYVRYLEKGFTQIYKALYGDAMLVSLGGAQILPPETNRKICLRVLLQMRKFIKNS